MPVDKFSVSLPEELVADVDEIASADGMTRSAVIREATADYVAARRSADSEAKRRERVDRAIAGFADLARRWGPDERTGVQYLADLRSEDASHAAEAPDDRT